MKKILLCLLLLILPITANAASITLKLNCPESINAGEVLNCTLSLSKNGSVKTVSGNFGYAGLTYNSFEKNGIFSAATVNSNSFSLSRNGGFDDTYTLGTLKLNVPSSAVDPYTISITQVRGKDISDVDIIGTNVFETVRIKSKNNKLKSLSIINGPSIDFDNNTPIYDVETSAETISIVANKEDYYAKVTGDGMKNLEYGLNKFEVVVTSESGSSRKFTLNITRKDDRNSDNTLSSLKVSSINFNFDPNTTTYNLNTDESSVSITAAATSNKAKVTGDGIKNLNYGLNKFEVVVTAENGSKNTYTLNITRGNLDSTALSNLTASGIGFIFNPYTLEYDLSTDLATTTIIATPANGKSSVKGDGIKNLKYGLNKFEVVVTDLNNNKRTYTLNITRINNDLDDSSLSNINIPGISFEFNPTILTYNLSTKTSAITILPTTTSTKSKVTGDGIKNLNLGLNTYKLVVTSQSGNTTTYVINVNLDNNTMSGAYLSKLEVSGIPFTFMPNMVSYNLKTDLDEVNITASAVDGATITGTGTKKLNKGPNEFKIVVKRGNDSRTYHLYIIKGNENGAVGEEGENNNIVNQSASKLSSLVVTGSTIDFDPNTYTYDIETSFNTVNIIAESDDKNVTITGVGEKKLNIGNNPCEITLKNEDGFTTIYLVNITRKESSNEEGKNNNGNGSGNKNNNGSGSGNNGEVLNGHTAKIRNIIIKDHEFNYNPEVYNYNLISNASRLDITVITEDITAGVVIKGNRDLKDGSVITITSVISDGTFNTYSIKIVNEKVEENTIQTKTLNLEQMIILGLLFLMIFILLLILIFRRKKDEKNNS